MFFKKIIINSGFFIVFIGKFCASEWIEIPEFSDNTKIYRLSGKQKGKFSENTTRNPELLNSTNFFKISPLTTTARVFISNDFVPIISVMRNESDFGNEDDSDEAAVIIEDDETMTENPNTTELPGDKRPEKGDSHGGSFLDYLPVELLKGVHKTLLENRPLSVDGKVKFLKSFEFSLLDEIESKLIPLVNPVRRKRGSGWEEEHMGFPSLEGALLAISFLTFAAYLVQLVIALFQHLSNSQPTTVLVNRNRRSITIEETERILTYLDEFSLKNTKNAIK